MGMEAEARTKELPPVSELAAVKELPDPFRFTDGKRVKTKKDWERRRQELERLVQHYAYGHLPPAGGKVRVEETASIRLDGVPATEKSLRLNMGPGRKIHARLVLTIPDGHGPFPAIVDGDLGWGRRAPEIVAEAVRRGYLLAEFDRTDLVPDKNERTGTLNAAYPDGDFGALAGWAWGYHRVADYLLTLPQVDGKRLIATGHSRGGKAALLAGALDERFALTAPNNSGCMGAGNTRFPHEGETLERIVTVFPYWFSPRLKEFIGKEDRLPFDQHELKALVAPRALLTTEGMGDTWANPPGTQMTHQAAKLVYDFLGAGDKIGVVFRPGGHGHTPEDWTALFDFADAKLLGKTVKRPFDTLAYPDEARKAFTWAAPEPD